jgi:hypothetical protein
MANLTIKYKAPANHADLFHGQAKRLGDDIDRVIYRGEGAVEKLIKEGTWALVKAMISNGFKFSNLEALEFVYLENDPAKSR